MTRATVIIRDALEADVPAIVEIVNAFLPTTTAEWRETNYTADDRREWLATHRRAGHPVLVAEVDGEVAGFSCYGDFRDAQKWPGYRFVVENTIHVREKFWGNGVGRTLIEALLARAASAGKRTMVAAVDADNIGSIRFHERCGFIEVGRMPSIGFKFGRWLTLVLLQRPVDRVTATGFTPDEDDVPSRIDLGDPKDAAEWERTAQARPGRREIFNAIAREIRALGERPLTVLELGSGPGFLAAHLLETIPDVSLVLLDSSTAMHELARARLRSCADRVVYVGRNFKQPGWQHGLGPFDAIVTNQSVHELRHKRHAAALHAATKTLLKCGAPYLMSDHHYRPGLGNERLYMTEMEHRDALLAAGFTEATLITVAGALVLYRAT